MLRVCKYTKYQRYNQIVARLFYAKFSCHFTMLVGGICIKYTAYIPIYPASEDSVMRIWGHSVTILFDYNVQERYNHRLLAFFE